MRFSAQQAANRREFIRAAVRHSVLGGLTALGVFFSKRGQLSGQRCVNQGICRGCVAFQDCGLPAALSAKAAQAGG